MINELQVSVGAGEGVKVEVGIGVDAEIGVDVGIRVKRAQAMMRQACALTENCTGYNLWLFSLILNKTKIRFIGTRPA
jgi:hypothetical protein